MKNIETLCNEYRENKRLIDELQAMNDALKMDIIAAMNGAEQCSAGACKVSNKLVCSTRFDTAGFKHDLPELYGRYSMQTEYRRFTVV